MHVNLIFFAHQGFSFWPNCWQRNQPATYGLHEDLVWFFSRESQLLQNIVYPVCTFYCI